MDKNILIYGSPEPSFFNEIVEKAREKRGSIVVAVPDQFKLETEQTLLEMLGGPLLHVRVMSFSGIARKVLSASDVFPISHVGKRLFLIRILRENKDRLKVFGRHIHKQGFLRELGEILSDMSGELRALGAAEGQSRREDQHLQEGGPPPGSVSESAACESAVSESAADAIPKELTDKIHDINLIYEAYGKISETYIGDEKLIGLAAKEAGNSEFVKDSVFYISHYDFFTDNEHALYLALSEHARGVRMSLLCGDSEVYAYTRRLLRKIPSTVKVFSQNEFREAENAAESSSSVRTVLEERMLEVGQAAGQDGAGRTLPEGSRDGGYAFFHALSELMFSQNPEGLKELIRPHLHAESADHSKVVFSADSPLEVCECDTRYNEATYIAGRIAKLIAEGVLPSEITVVLPKREMYEGMLEHVLSRAGIPFFVDRDRVFDETPLAAFISALIDYNTSPSMRSLSEMLATEIFPISVGHALRLQLAAREHRLKADAEFERILEILKFKDLGARFTVSAFVRELYRILTTTVEYRGERSSVMLRCERHSFSMRHIANETTEEVEYGARIWNAFMGVLEELDELSGISGEIDLSIARTLIDVSARVARVPNRREYVSITSPDRVRSLRSKYCFVPGALRGELPSIAQSASVFSPEEQEGILDAARITRFFDYEKEIYRMHLLLTSPWKKLVFTHPQGNRSVLLAYLLEAGGKKGFYSPQEIFAPAGLPRSKPNAEIARTEHPAQEDTEFHFSQSRLQSYLKCPYRYFITYVVKAREERPNELSPMDSGNIVHRIMEIFVDEYSEANALRDLDHDVMLERIRDSEEKYRSAVEDIYRRIAASEEVVTADVKSGALYRKRFVEACTRYAQVIDYHLAAGAYEVASTEGKMKGFERFEGDFETDFTHIFPELFEIAPCGDATCDGAGGDGLDVSRGKNGVSNSVSSSVSNGVSNSVSSGDAGRLRDFVSMMNRGCRGAMEVRLYGTFDRMDRAERGYRLIDYKTSDSYDGRLSKLFLLDYIQLGLYAHLIALRDETVEGEGGTTEREERTTGAGCEGLNILNLVDLEMGDTFIRNPMQGVVSVEDGVKGRYCRDESHYHNVVRRRRSEKSPEFVFSRSGEYARRQRGLLAKCLMEAFEATRARRPRISALLKAAGEKFFRCLQQGEAGGIVEFEIIMLWSRLMTWAVAKGIAAGDFEPDTSDEDYCKYCNFKAMCRYDLRRG